jgi:excinuclease ABC subunit C
MPAFDGKAFAKSLSTDPGVYLMRDDQGQVLYVGKAKNLQRRVASYFNGQDKGPRINLMIKKIAAMEVSLTRTETEALLLENEWIKAFKPRFNINLRDDKSYPWIRLSVDHPYPLVSFYRGQRRQKGEFYGPYSSIHAVRQSLNQIYKLFKLRQCRDSVFENRTRPCLQYQINRCSAPCVGCISKAAYQRDVDAAKALLKGEDDRVIQYMIERMSEASEGQDYEQAAVFRDHIQSLQAVRSHQYVIGQQTDVDVIGLFIQSGSVAVHVVSFRNGRNVGGRTFFPTNVRPDDASAAVLAAFLGQYYQDHRPPRELIVPTQPDEASLWVDALSQQRGTKVDIKSKLRGERRQWLESAMRNAEDALRRRLAQKDQWGQGLDALVELLQLSDRPERMECFDISHSSGQDTMGSCVVFGPDGPIKRDYRLYGINDAPAGDDYAAMAEVLKRRYQRALKTDQTLPDLIVVDGGKGQLSQAQAVMAELGITEVTLLGMAKGPGRRAGHERLILGEREVVPGPHHGASHVLQQIRDEAHRFAVSGHRRRRQKTAHQSVLDQVEGIGPTKRKRLLQHFGGQEGLINASVEDLTRVTGISQALAERLHETLHTQSAKAAKAPAKTSSGD